MSRKWIYDVYMGKWWDSSYEEYGYPSKGDWYEDAGEWRIW